MSFLFISHRSHGTHGRFFDAAFSVLSEISVCPNTEFWRRNQGADTLPEYLDIRSPFIGGSRISYSGEFIPPD